MAYTHNLKVKSSTGNFTGKISYDGFEINGLPTGESGGYTYSSLNKVNVILDLFRALKDNFGTIEEIEITEIK